MSSLTSTGATSEIDISYEEDLEEGEQEEEQEEEDSKDVVEDNENGDENKITENEEEEISAL